MKYKFHPGALEEYREAAIWYANREQELAQQFIASIEDAFTKSSRHRIAGG